MTDDAQSLWYKKCQFLNQCDCCTRKKINIKAFKWAALNANSAWTSKLTEQISAILMLQAMLCVFKKDFLLENTILTLKQKLFINV